MTQSPKRENAKVVVGGAALGAGGVAALALAIVGIKSDEGKRLVDYRDLAGIPTACYGHTGPDAKVGTKRTDVQCEAMLSSDVLPRLLGVSKCVPALTAKPAVWAASTRMAYNTGVPAFCGSGTAQAFRAGQWRSGCDAMLAWNKARVNGKLVVVAGLAARRERERAQCLTGV
jgi:lysozyme